MFSQMFISLFALTALIAIPNSTMALPTGESDSETQNEVGSASSVFIHFGEHTAHISSLNISDKVHNGSDTIASLAMGKSIGNEHSFYFYTYDDTNTTQFDCDAPTYKSLKASENQAQYNLTNVIPLKPVTNNTDVASLKCVTSSAEVYNSNSTDTQ
ncbi:hypothetical protein I203_105028 [Kwoniella mangroviensis CBS 8507]|uniref:uncharacterized protein n=1 Tax=Kwoniella mangroviensis CBS 8507 TaxID=1296122 RepID=UPI00080D0904|nr:uncharacterized protein I203_00025 [Kwoniella mangroviensis CBS 8507]OCF69898.1 hypothetical protein I203_00025 [Kwoniella mangroviensis CBS 8507]